MLIIIAIDAVLFLTYFTLEIFLIFECESVLAVGCRAPFDLLIFVYCLV